MNRIIRLWVWWDTRPYLHRLTLIYGAALLAFLVAGFVVFKSGIE